MEGQRTPEILDYRNENGHGWFCYKNNGVLRMIGTTIENDLKVIRKVQKFQLRDDDMMLAAYPKCGTHWLWEIVNMLRAGNSEYSRKTKEIAMLGMPKFERADELPSPRVLNSHLYFRHLPEKMAEKRIKTIFIMRNPKDVSVSSYCMINGLKDSFGFDGTYSEFLDLFLEGKVPGGVYADYVKDWLQVKQDNPDLPVLTLFYENLKKDPVKNIKMVANFIGVSVSDELCEQIAEACSFKKMRTADAQVKEQLVNVSETWKEGQKGIYRKGEVGDWKDWITVAENERFDDVIERTFEGTGISFTAPEILDHRNVKGQGWRFYKNDGILRRIVTTPEDDEEMIRKVQKFELRDDDVMIAAYPRCGTHWLWEIVTMLRAGNSEYNKMPKVTAILGTPKSSKLASIFPSSAQEDVEKRIKTIFIRRNPKDVSVSYFNMVNGSKDSFGFDGTYSEYLDLFLEGNVPSGDYVDYVKDWLQVKQENPDFPMLTRFYENLKNDPVKEIKTVAEFLGVSVTDEFCEQIAEALRS